MDSASRTCGLVDERCFVTVVDDGISLLARPVSHIADFDFGESTSAAGDRSSH